MVWRFRLIPPRWKTSDDALLKMLAQDHPGEGLTQTPEKPFYRYALQYGLTESDFNGSHEPKLLDDSHPYIHVDMSQCIVCYRCVRICAEVQGQFVWQILNRGHETQIVPDSGQRCDESSCVSCGACVDYMSQRGALEDKSRTHSGKADELDSNNLLPIAARVVK